MGTIANAKVTHYYNCYNGDFIGCLLIFDHMKRKFSCKEIKKSATTYIIIQGTQYSYT